MTQVRVKDFGPIAEASVELKPLTVFMGPNNSGKSYLALAIYCMSKTLLRFPDISRNVGPPLRSDTGEIFPQELLRQAGEELKQAWPNAPALPHGRIRVADLAAGLQDVLSQANQFLAEGFTRGFGMELERCYGTKVDSLVRRGASPGATRLEAGLAQPGNDFAWDMYQSQGHMVTRKWDSGLLKQPFHKILLVQPIEDAIDNPERFLVDVGLRQNYMHVRDLVMPAHYIPASRSGILLAHKTLISHLVDRESRAWLGPIEIHPLPGVVTDLIQAILGWEHAQPSNAKLQEAASFLERDLTQGTVDMDPSAEYPDIYYENDSGRFLLHQVSSMVSEVAPIILYLKHRVKEGHLFIIEEPESHLDAANQMKLARAIAMLVNAGVYMLITTHSDFFVKQLDNLLLLSQLTPRRRAARKYSANEVLQPEQVGAYYFDPGEEGSRVRTLEVTADGGIPTHPFTEAHTTLYDEAIALEHIAR